MYTYILHIIHFMRLRFIQNFKLLEVLHATQVELDQLGIVSTAKGYNFGKRESYEKCMFNQFKYLPAGLWQDIYKLNKSGWNIIIENLSEYVNTKYSKEDYAEWCENLDITCVPYGYQLDACYLTYKYQHAKVAVDTGGGKSLIQYIICRHMLERELDIDKKILLVVPSIMLCNQMENNFNEYQEYADIKYITVDKIYGGSKRNKLGNVIVGNIDSLVNYDSDFFQQFGAVIFDEAHKMGSSKSYRDIIHMLPLLQIKHIVGLSGTFHTSGIDKLYQDAYLGPTVITVPAHYMMELGTVSKLKITVAEITYNKMLSRGYYEFEGIETEKTRYHAENRYTRSLIERIDIISTLANRVDGNQVMLFTSKSHMSIYKHQLVQKCPNKQIFEISGDIESSERTRIANYLEEHSDCIVVATYQTLSTGVSIKNIMHLHFIDTCKSFIRVVQSIGRAIRLHPSKDFAQVWDWVDIFVRENDEQSGPRTNIAARHAVARRKIYKSRKYEYVVKKISI